MSSRSSNAWLAALAVVTGLVPQLLAGLAFGLVEGPAAGFEKGIESLAVFWPILVLGLALAFRIRHPESGLVKRIWPAFWGYGTVLLILQGAIWYVGSVGTRLQQQSIDTSLASQLRAFSTLQRYHRAEYDEYSSDPGAFGFQTSNGVELEYDVTPTGWTARVTHEDDPDRSCVSFGGGVERPLPTLAGQIGEPEEVLCDARDPAASAGPFERYLLGFYWALKRTGI